MDEAWERAVTAAASGGSATLTLDGAAKCPGGRIPPASVSRFPDLTHLSIANVRLASLDGFPLLPRLHRLVLSDNRITGGLAALTPLAALRDLDLSNNRISSLEELAPLAGMGIESLDLYECPVTKVEGYRGKVFAMIKSLKFLDKVDAEGNERPESDEEEEEDEDEKEDEEAAVSGEPNEVEEEDEDDDDDEGDDEEGEDDEDEDEEETTEQGDCSKFKANPPHCCKRDPTVVDLLPGTPYNMQIANCCKGGVINTPVQDPANAASSFQVSVGQFGTTNKTVRAPKNFTLKAPGPGYMCGVAKSVTPTKFVSQDGRRTTQALSNLRKN